MVATCCPACGQPVDGRRKRKRNLGLTPKQAELLAFISKYQAEHNGVSPTFDEMAAALGLAGKSGIHRLITGLEERDAIRRLHHRARAIEVLAGGAAP